MATIKGIVSGLATDNILSQLRTISERPVRTLEARKAALTGKSQAWEDMGEKLTAFQSAARSLIQKFTFRPMLATTSNAGLLGVQATGSPEAGTHTLRVTQMAGTQSSLSGAAAAADVAVTTAGVLTFRPGNGTEDRDVTGSTKLSFLNNGAGVRAGAIRVTDRTGASAVIDLTGDITVQDVLDDISSAAGIAVTASLNAAGTGIVVRDDTGSTNGPVIIEEAGGDAASDLGIATGPAGVLAAAVEGADLDPLYRLEVGSANNTLNGLRDAINALGAPFSAAVVNDGSGTPYRLSLTGRFSGDAGGFAIAWAGEPGADPLAFTTIQAAQDAILEVGETAPQSFRSRTNVFDKAIAGLTVNVIAADPTKTVQVAVNPNVTDAGNAVAAFINGFNTVVAAVNSHNAFDAETGTKGGALFGAPLLSRMLSDLTRAVTDNVAGLPANAASPFQLGVKAGKRGALDLNSGVLQDWITNRFSEAQDILTRTANAALGAVRSASSTAVGFDAATVADGITDPALFGAGQGWMDDTPQVFPDYVTLNFGSARSVTKAVIHGLDSATSPAAAWGLRDFDLQALRLGGDAARDGDWVSVGSIRGNTRGVTTIPVSVLTEQLRIKILSVNAGDGRSRVLEFEAHEAGGATLRTAEDLSRLTDVREGALTVALKGISDEQKRLDTQIDTVQKRVDREMARLEAQFNAMETSLSRLQNMSAALTSFFSGGITTNTSSTSQGS